MSKKSQLDLGANPTGRVRSAAIIAEQRRKERRRRIYVQAGIFAVLLVVVLGTTIAILSKSDNTPTVSAPAGMTTTGAVVIGDSASPVTVTLVEDFGCPHCRAFEAEAGKLLAGYEAGKDVKVEYRGIAFLDRVFSSDYSTRALNASACVAASSDVEIWKRFHDALYNQQPAEGSAGLTNGQLASIASTAGATAPKVATCISKGSYRSWVSATTDATMGHGGVEGTPTVFVNGTLVDQPSAATIAAAVTKASGA